MALLTVSTESALTEAGNYVLPVPRVTIGILRLQGYSAEIRRLHVSGES